ncbi:unnamed protein product [Prorocentrum cordatum]|uniref:Protein kinase domain-containing protein n=1 Tax=Prorocentrum cordatum TaxID=2364126 RepID=A0ABN9TB72_9DINO|nr:unnamed protein product [Polarella glacialis]
MRPLRALRPPRALPSECRPTKGRVPRGPRTLNGSLIERNKLIQWDSWCLKVIQLYETSLVRHGFMLVGPTLCGKSEIASMLTTCMTEDNNAHRIVTMNPKVFQQGAARRRAMARVAGAARCTRSSAARAAEGPAGVGGARRAWEGGLVAGDRLNLADAVYHHTTKEYCGTLLVKSCPEPEGVAANVLLGSLEPAVEAGVEGRARGVVTLKLKFTEADSLLTQRLDPIQQEFDTMQAKFIQIDACQDAQGAGYRCAALAGVPVQTARKPEAQYSLLEELGRGTYCTVRRAQDREGAEYAVKALSRAVLSSRQVSLFTREGAQAVPLQTRVDTDLRILGDHPHPHVVGLVEVIDDPALDTLYVVLDGHARWAAHGVVRRPQRLRGALRAVAGQRAGLPRGGRRGAAGAAADGRRPPARARHNPQGLDLKPDNVLLGLPVPAADPRLVRPLPARGAAEGAKACPEAPTADGALRELVRQCGFVAKVADFNTAVVCALPDCHIWDAEGTQQFTPPECFDPQRDGAILGQPRDMWSVGCLLFAMLFGRCPFWDEESRSGCSLRSSRSPWTRRRRSTSPAAWCHRRPRTDLIRQLLRKDPAGRPLAAAALQHPWVL